MRVQTLTVMEARIPLKTRVEHASHSRSENATILVRCQLDDGTVGWGEGLPRKYVTGETIEMAWQQLSECAWGQLASPWESLEELIELATPFQLPRPPGSRECFGHAARCAVELAILDAGCRSLEKPVADLLRRVAGPWNLAQAVSEVHYSAALTAGHPLKVAIRGGLFRYYGFRQCKVKIGLPGQNDRRLLRILRCVLGSDIELRVDANEAWMPSEVADRLQTLSEFGIVSVEQPVPHSLVDELAHVRQRACVPIMLDESLCCEDDARRAIDLQLCDAFNLRLSKCGGMIPSIRLAVMARQAGLSYQLGCQVGETGILSAAGRQFATSITGLTAVEGSFDRLLVREPLTVEDLTFGRRGRGRALAGLGLGMTIDEAAVDRVCRRRAIYRVA
jgi:muconate cycloisomerase